MKAFTKTGISVAMAATILTGAVVGPATAAPHGAKQVPFSGSLQALEHSVFQGPPPGTLVVDGSGSGIATHFGRYTVTWNFLVNLADGTGSGPVSFIAANGDAVFSTALGRSEPTDTTGSSILWKSKPSRAARVDSRAPKGVSLSTV
jgi:hypothetical protein